MGEKPTTTADPKADHALFGRRVGRFVIRELIDEGGCGAVYRCEQPALERDVVIKVMHERSRHKTVARGRFLREAQLASRLDHPYAAHIYDFGVEREDGLMWLVMELVRGVTLAAWLGEHGAMPLGQFVPLFERVCEVVQAAHDLKCVHRDLKPSNVMVIERGGQQIPKLLDFGIAKADRSIAPLDPSRWPNGSLGENQARADAARDREGPITKSDPEPKQWGLTPANSHMGSAAYMSPEQWLDVRDVGPASDIYALGILAYTVLADRQPFVAETDSGYYHHHIGSEVPPLGGTFSPSIDRILQRALAKRAEDRFGTALEFAAALRAELRAEQRTQPLEHLRILAHQWTEHGRPRNQLLKASVLDTMQLPAAEVLSESEESYLAASRKHIARNRRRLAVLGATAVMGGALAVIEYRATVRTEKAEQQTRDEQAKAREAALKASAAEQLVNQAEVEQGRAALLHGELADAQAHLGEAYRRGDHSAATEFMLSRALQPKVAELARFTAVAGRMWSSAWSPDGKRIITTDDKAAQVWDVQTHQRILTLHHPEAVHAAVFAIDGTNTLKIVTAGSDGRVREWDSERGLLLRELVNDRGNGERPRYRRLVVSLPLVAALDINGDVADVWDAARGVVLASLHGDATGVPSLDLSRDA